MLHSKSFESEHEHVEPANADLDLIRKFAQREVKADEIWCGGLHACNTKVDRAGERFTKAYLQRFQETLPGKALLEGHNYDRRPIGRIYKAEVVPEGDGHFLKAWYYLKADSPVVSEIELGIARDCSIGYNAHRRVCDLDGKEWNPYGSGDDFCSHWPLQEYDEGVCTLAYCDTAVQKAEAMEMSLVWHGCQYGAEAVAKTAPGPVAYDYQLVLRMMAQHFPAGREGAKGMTEQEMLAKLAELEGSHQKSVGDLQKQLQDLKAQAEEGTAYRTWLRSQIAKFAGLLKEDEIWASWASNEKATVEVLMPVYETLGKRVDEKFSQGQGRTDGPRDPNALHTPAVPTHQRRRLSWIR